MMDQENLNEDENELEMNKSINLEGEEENPNAGDQAAPEDEEETPI